MVSTTTAADGVDLSARARAGGVEGDVPMAVLDLSSVVQESAKKCEKVQYFACLTFADPCIALVTRHVFQPMLWTPRAE